MPKILRYYLVIGQFMFSSVPTFHSAAMEHSNKPPCLVVRIVVVAVGKFDWYTGRLDSMVRYVPLPI